MKSTPQFPVDRMDRLERIGFRLDQVLLRVGWQPKDAQSSFERRGYRLGRALYRLRRRLPRL